MPYSSFKSTTQWRLRMTRTEKELSIDGVETG
jgi:hypothetical protein